MPPTSPRGLVQAGILSIPINWRGRLDYQPIEANLYDSPFFSLHILVTLIFGRSPLQNKSAERSPTRLILEKSPYLLQHAYNPVDWYPWGSEAFEKAKKEEKPVFLSIGYSTCHWCHVMERESFENQEVAELLNEAFVCIKVDREERPDIDSTYIRVC